VHAPHTKLALMRMANSVSINPVEKFNKKLCTGQSVPVAHPNRRMMPSNISDVGTDRWSFISDGPATGRLINKPHGNQCTQHPDTVRATRLTKEPWCIRSRNVRACGLAWTKMRQSFHGTVVPPASFNLRRAVQCYCTFIARLIDNGDSVLFI